MRYIPLPNGSKYMIYSFTDICPVLYSIEWHLVCVAAQDILVSFGSDMNSYFSYSDTVSALLFALLQEL